MRVVVAGALGGIGQHLVAKLQGEHEVTGVVRSLPSRSASRSRTQYVASSDRDALRDCLQSADVIIHAALDPRKHGRALVRTNNAFTRELLELSKGGTARIFVYFSSWVVYSGTPQGPEGYRENDRVETDGKLDSYTRLKLLDERTVRDSCGSSGIGYLILRPTVVVGPGMDGYGRGAARLPIGVAGGTLNLIHVNDLCETVDRLIEHGVVNEVFNLGGDDFPSEDFFVAAGRAAGTRMRFPSLVQRSKRVFPSTLWFLKSEVRLRSERVRDTTGFVPERSLDELVAPDPLRDGEADSLDTMRRIRESGVSFKAYGAGYAAVLSPLRRVELERRIRLIPHRGIVSLHGDVVTVKSGTRLSEITDVLDKADLTLATMPEFMGATAGACFFVDIHGSSNEYFSVADLILEVKYLDSNGDERTAKRGDSDWDALRRRDDRFFLTEVTFQCERSGYLTKRIEFLDDEELTSYLAQEHRKNLSTVIQWFPHYGIFMVHHINRADSPPPNAARPTGTARAMPYRFVRWVYAARLRGKDTLYGRHAAILGSFRRARGIELKDSRRRNPPVYDTEICVTLEDAGHLVNVVRASQRRRGSPFGRRDSIGVRFSYRATDDGGKSGYVWLEQASRRREAVEQFADLVAAVASEGVRFHQGKYVPARFVRADRRA
ncbi:MAG: NAD-dependent epimerase/dehydratase family protein [Dehalococcoidia bacterium]